MPQSQSPAFTAFLFGLSGCLVDFGARTLPLALGRLLPDCLAPRLAEAAALPPRAALDHALGAPASEALHQAFLQQLLDAASEHAEAVPGLDELAALVDGYGVPCAWLDELPAQVCWRLAAPLPTWMKGSESNGTRPWPAPDNCWQALSGLGVPHLDGCVLVSANPRLLESGLNAGIWTIGLAASGPLCGLAPADWRALDGTERDRLRATATLELYRLGAHSVIDHLGELAPCLADLAYRREKGEKP
ncbi:MULTISPECIES: HAD family phosphatase [unclassified Pseudomonas]|uniref:HAD family phosphatase n=1 Tax=unclassified Pseudomonas TaxID=196821 RepID=UPI00129D8FFF|nr:MULTISPECIES: HAD family phosphatase [unclassified Pseudomonas]MDH4653789.1 HAD family phosphatase [Pseudomonas sp. BN606]MRK22737.1 HAD family phosphatase [Pseudomonas sp. JG-B]